MKTRILRLALLLIGTAIVSWNVSAYRSNVAQSRQVEVAFKDFLHDDSLQTDDIDDEFYSKLMRTRMRCMTADGLYDGWNNRMPWVIFGGVLILGGLLSFMVKPKKNVAEQVAASDC
jgi:hypothetical protein